MTSRSEKLMGNSMHLFRAACLCAGSRSFVRDTYISPSKPVSKVLDYGRRVASANLPFFEKGSERKMSGNKKRSTIGASKPRTVSFSSGPIKSRVSLCEKKPIVAKVSIASAAAGKPHLKESGALKGRLARKKLLVLGKLFSGRKDFRKGSAKAVWKTLDSKEKSLLEGSTSRLAKQVLKQVSISSRKAKEESPKGTLMLNKMDEKRSGFSDRLLLEMREGRDSSTRKHVQSMLPGKKRRHAFLLKMLGSLPLLWRLSKRNWVHCALSLFRKCGPQFGTILVHREYRKLTEAPGWSRMVKLYCLSDDHVGQAVSVHFKSGCLLHGRNVRDRETRKTSFVPADPKCNYCFPRATQCSVCKKLLRPREYESVHTFVSSIIAKLA